MASIRETEKTWESIMQLWEESCSNFKQKLDQIGELLIQLARMYWVSIPTEIKVNWTEIVGLERS